VNNKHSSQKTSAQDTFMLIVLYFLSLTVSSQRVLSLYAQSGINIFFCVFWEKKSQWFETA